MTLAKKEPRDYAPLKLMASTGLRVSAIVKLLQAHMTDSDGPHSETPGIRMTVSG